MEKSTTLNAPETFGHSQIKHPYCDCTLSHAVKVAQGIAGLNFEKVTSLTQARSIIEASLQSCGHVWITGTVALDVLDAAIDGRDLNVDNRLFIPAPMESTPEARAIASAKKAVAAGEISRYHVSDGCLDVEIDGVWRQWFPDPDYNAAEALD